MRSRVLLTILLLFSLALSGCSLPWKKKSQSLPDPANASEESVVEDYGGQLKKFKDLQSLDSFLRSNAGNPEAMEDEGYQGEPVAIFGDYIYASVYNDLYIAKATAGEQGRAVAKISFNSRPLAVFAINDKLVVITKDEMLPLSQAYKSFRRKSPYVSMKVFGLADPASPKQVRDLSIEGRLLDVTSSGEGIRLLMENYSGYYAGETPTPRLVDGGRILSNDCSSGSRCFLPETYYFDVAYDRARVVSVDMIDLSKDDSLVTSTAFVLSSQQEALFSGDSLYVTYRGEYDGSDAMLVEMGKVIEPKLSEEARALADKIRQTEVDVLSPSEKVEKVSSLYKSYLLSLDETEALALDSEIESSLKAAYALGKSATTIYKFRIGNKEIAYNALGKLEGQLVPGALSEDKSGNVRAVTLKKEALDADGELSARAYASTLDVSLKPLGSPIELAGSDPITQTAFSDGRLAILSGSAVYSADLSDPKQLKILGRVEIPNVLSIYLYNNSNIIALADENGQAKAVLIDISGTVARENDTFRLGQGSDTYLSTGSRFKVVDGANNHIVIPVTRRQGAAISFSGITALSISEGRFVLRGDVDHSDGGRYLQEDASLGAGYRNNTVRSTWIKNGALYTFSNKYIKVNALEGGSVQQEIKLLPDTEEDLVAAKPEITQETSNPVASDPIGPALPPAQQPAAEEPIGEPIQDPIMEQPLGEATTTPDVPATNPEGVLPTEIQPEPPITDPIDTGILP